VLRTFRVSYPGHALQPELTKKLAFAYKEAGELSLAAAEYERVAAEARDAAVRSEALLVAGELYAQAKELDNAYPVYLRYVKEFPKPLETSLEIHTKIAEYLKTRDNLKDYLIELKYIQDADASAGPERTPRTRFLGASAALEFAEIEVRKFSTIKIEEPFDQTLAMKKEAMKVTKDHLDILFGYEVEEITSAATFYLAEMYYDFNRKLVTSERPEDLSPLEKEQYELSIEEQAYPFEEKAIQIHQKNLELMTRNIFNSWIEKSMEKLAVLVPARYAKFEESSGFIDAIDNVSYAALVDPKPVTLKPSPAGIAPASGMTPVQGVPPVQKNTTESDRANPVTIVN
jgi:tetratricopeptide (TPR) repeat protein